MKLDELYQTLRKLVSDKYRIEIRDGSIPQVAILPDQGERFPWTHFRGFSLEDALTRAITKLGAPSIDYRDIPTIIDSEGCLWPADQESCYSENHIKVFLRKYEATMEVGP